MRHWYTFLANIAGWVLCLGVLIAIRGYLHFNYFGYWNIIVLVIPALAIINIWYRVILWRSTTVLITNQRVVKTDRAGLFSHTTTELLHKDIIEVSYRKQGFGAAILNFGTIILRTASNSVLEVTAIPAPAVVTDTLNSLRL